jgi:parvulin-like peptidyl-prolyl isomerase
MNPILVIVGALLCTQALQANDKVEEAEILAKRGKGVVTQAEFTARANKIPLKVRHETLRNRNRVQDVINNLLLRSQLAADAREAKFDQEQVVKARMQLAADAELADAWMQHYVEAHPEADYEQLAYEYYQLNKDEMMTSPAMDVSHILISTYERPDEEALQLAESIYDQLQTNPAEFDQLVLQYSEDPSAASNNGHFENVKKGDFVKGFEDAAFSLEEGEISQPVKTEYGYHIIRLDAFTGPEPVEFEEVKPRLVDAEREKHETRIKQDYLSSLSSLEVEMTEEALREMARRQFGEEVLVPEAAAEKTE